MFAPVEVDDAPHVHPLVAQDYPIILACDREWVPVRPRRGAPRRGRNGTPGHPGGFYRATAAFGGCQKLHHRLLTARAAAGHRSEQPRTDDVATCLHRPRPHRYVRSRSVSGHRQNNFGKEASVRSFLDWDPSIRTSVPALSICGVIPLRLSCVNPCDSQTYCCVLPFSSTAAMCR